MVDEKDKQKKKKSMKGDRQMDAMKTARYPRSNGWRVGGRLQGWGRHVKWEIAVVHWPEMIQ